MHLFYFDPFMFEQERSDTGTSFRLCSLRLFDHPILHNINLNFCDENDSSNNVYTTVIIGENGIGKSCLLGALAEILCYLEKLKLRIITIPPRYYFDLVYKLNNRRIKFTNFMGDCPKEGRKIFTHSYLQSNGIKASIDVIELTQRVIASASTITDKFVAKSTEIYRYKGLRNENSPSTTGTKTMVRKTVLSLLESLDVKSGFRQELKDLLKYLKLSPRLELSYRLTNAKYLINKNIEANNIKDLLEKRKKRNDGDRDDYHVRDYRLSVWGEREQERIVNEDELRQCQLVADFCRKLSMRQGQDNYLRYNLLEEGNKVCEDKEALKALDSMRLLSYPSLKVFKKNDGYEFDNSSSGESSLFCQLVNIMSVIEPGSMILVDEPECSTHPNWQTKYINWLEHIFQKYNTCHFIISTHSHLLLSDLKDDSSSIIALARDKETGKIINMSEGLNTYGWSTDDILYEVFGIRNKHNKALERDLERAFVLLEKNGPVSQDELQMIVARFNKVYCGVRDPLGALIQEINEYVKSRS